MPYNSNDNIRVTKPAIQEPIKYKLQPGEVRLPSGQIIKVRQAELSQGSSEPEVLRDQRYKKLTRQHEWQKQKEREARTIQGLTAPLQLISPSHIIGSANSDKPFLEAYLGDSYNSATGTMLGDFALDAVVGGGLWKGAKVAGDLSRTAITKAQPYIKARKIAKELDKGIQENSLMEAYNKIPQNKDVGDIFDYQTYVDNIFPESKLSGLYYHGGIKGITKFTHGKNTNINTGTKDFGMYFTPSKVLSNRYANTHRNNGQTYIVKLDAKNPIKYKSPHAYYEMITGTENLVFSPASITKKWYDRLNLKQYDAILHRSQNKLADGEVVMFNPDQIHILGTSDDYHKFKNFTQSKSKNYTLPIKHDEIPSMSPQYDKTAKNYWQAYSPIFKMAAPIASVAAVPFIIDAFNKKSSNTDHRIIKSKHIPEIDTLNINKGR